MIIFTGVAGSGKSSQGRLLADGLGYPWLSTGEFLRMLISGQHRLDMQSGKLLSDSEMIELVQKIFTLIDVKQEFVLDGFPRTLTQADWLISQIKHKQLHITAVIHLIASENVVMERLVSRGRQDDNETAIRQRFEEYQGAILPILKDLKKAGVKVYDVSGEGDTETIHARILKDLKLTK